MTSTDDTHAQKIKILLHANDRLAVKRPVEKVKISTESKN